jgi:L-fuconolactonase
MPDVHFVLDHLGKPPVRSGDTEEWSKSFAQLARLPNVSCKLSGLVTEADWAAWDPEGLVVFHRRALDVFGPERCLFGSDWPVCLLAGSYDAVLDLVLAALDECTGAERAAVLGENAMRVYALSVNDVADSSTSPG